MLVLFGVIELSADALFAADAKPAWQASWENTVAAAKKEGKLNFYVGRYGTEPLLNEFRKEFPEIKLVTVNGTGNSLGHKDYRGNARWQCSRRSFQRRGEYELRSPLRRQGARFDQDRR